MPNLEHRTAVSLKFISSHHPDAVGIGSSLSPCNTSVEPTELGAYNQEPVLNILASSML